MISHHFYRLQTPASVSRELPGQKRALCVSGSALNWLINTNKQMSSQVTRERREGL